MVRALNGKYINFFTDFGFKRLFGSEQSKNILKDFLNEMFKDSPNMPNGVTPHSPIVSLRYMKNEQMGRSKLDRNAVFDVQCENECGEIFVIEMQKAEQRYFKDRSLFYSTFPIVEQAKKGDWNFELKPVYIIGILNFCFDKENDDKKYRHDVRMVEIETGKIFHDKLAFTYLEMPKFNKKPKELSTKFDAWLYAIKNLYLFEKIPANMKGDEILSEFFERAAVAQMSDKEYAAYFESLKAFRDNINTWEFALQKAEEKGLAEGLAEGELKAKLEMARNLLAEGIPIELISKATGLSLDKVRKIHD